LRPLLSGGSTKATTSDREMRGRRGLVALQVAMAVACVAVVVAVVQGQMHDFAGGPGYAYENVLTAQLHVRDSATWSDRAFIEQLRPVEGVSDVAIVHNHEIGGFLPEGAPPGINPHIGWSDVTPNYFTTVGPTLIAGRLPTQADVDAGARVAIVSERILHWLWCDNCDRPQVIPKTEYFLGRTLTLERPGGAKIPLTVIGVVSDVLTAPKFSAIESPVYTLGVLRSPGSSASLAIRLHGNREQAAQRVRERLRRDRTAAVISDVTLASHDVDQWYADERGKVMFLVGAACFALFLALMGVYSLTGHTAALRTREFGIRLALGATNGRVVGMLVREIWTMAALGSIAGLLLASRVIRTLDIYLRNPFALHPVVTFPLVPVTLAAAGLLGIAVVGTVLPARRALRMDIARVVTSET
jgi:putative ABC transport system permease protein